MNRHLARALLALYPRAWRARYGAEVADLTDDLISAGETTLLLAALNLIGGAALERGRALAGSRRAALAMAVTAVMAVAVSFYATTQDRPQVAPASLASASCVFREAGAAAIPLGIEARLKARAKARPGAGPCVMPGLCRPAARPGWTPAPAARCPAITHAR